MSRRSFLKILATGTIIALSSWGRWSLKPLHSLTRQVSAQPQQIPQKTPVAFNMLVLGDSIEWGQGLAESEKFYSLLAANLINLGFADVVDKRVEAHSGAIIGENVPYTEGPRDDVPTNQENWLEHEVPLSYPNLFQQVDQFLQRVDRFEAFTGNTDIVLLDGGLNDVGLTNIFSLTVEPSEIETLTNTACYTKMKLLLEKILSNNNFKDPKTKIIVTGYYQILSEESDRLSVVLLASALGLYVSEGIFGAIIGGVAVEVAAQKFISNAAMVARLANAKLQQAVDEINQEFGGSRVFFVDPGFGSQNAIYAPNTYLWGLQGSVGNLLAEDSVARGRSIACATSRKKIPFFSKDPVPIYCEWASMGHPNRQGAEAYANKIFSVISPALSSPTRGLFVTEEYDNIPLSTISLSPEQIMAGRFTVYIRKRGYDRLTVTRLEIAKEKPALGEFNLVSYPSLPATLTQDENQAIDVTGAFSIGVDKLHIPNTGTFESTLIIESNDPINPILKIPITVPVTMLVEVQPQVLPEQQPTQIIVTAKNSVTNAPVNGKVFLDGVEVGTTNVPFNHVFQVTHITQRIFDEESGRLVPTPVTVIHGATGKVVADGYSDVDISFPGRTIGGD